MSDNDRDEPRAAGGDDQGGGPEEPRQPAGGNGAPGTEAEEKERAKAAAAAKAKAKAEAAAKAKAAKEAAEAAKPAWERLPAAPAVEDAAADPLVETLGRAFGDAVGPATLRAGELAVEVRSDAIRGVCESLRLDHGFHLLVDICGVHYPQREEAPLEVVYHVYSLRANRRVRLKVAVAADESVPSVTGVWAGANWVEREVYDMFGVRFEDHPDMTRILMWEGFHGHPLLKDFPVEGVDTGSAIYPEYYGDESGPVAGTGTGWRPAAPPEEEKEAE